MDDVYFNEGRLELRSIYGVEEPKLFFGQLVIDRPTLPFQFFVKLKDLEKIINSDEWIVIDDNTQGMLTNDCELLLRRNKPIDGNKYNLDAFFSREEYQVIKGFISS